MFDPGGDSVLTSKSPEDLRENLLYFILGFVIFYLSDTKSRTINVSEGVTPTLWTLLACLHISYEWACTGCLKVLAAEEEKCVVCWVFAHTGHFFFFRLDFCSCVWWLYLSLIVLLWHRGWRRWKHWSSSLHMVPYMESQQATPAPHVVALGEFPEVGFLLWKNLFIIWKKNQSQFTFSSLENYGFTVIHLTFFSEFWLVSFISEYWLWTF